MKRATLLTVTLLLSSLFVFNGCKKGEDDPFLSLLSRKARLTGEWKLTKMEKTETEDGYTKTSIFEDGILTETETEISKNEGTKTYNYEEIVKFDKDGTFTMEMKKTRENHTEQYRFEGEWSFAGGNKELEMKNRERVMMQVREEHYNINGEEMTIMHHGDYEHAIMFRLRKLGNNEMIVETEYTESGDDDNISVDETKTYEKK